MWLMTTDGFYSVVRDKDGSGNFQVRSRAAKDLENLRARVGLAQPVIMTPAGDYPARLVIGPEELGAVVSALAGTVTYENFKSAIHATPGQGDKDAAYMDVWATMRRTEAGFLGGRMLYALPARKNPLLPFGPVGKEGIFDDAETQDCDAKSD